jgi:hypothetical protein
MMHFWFSFSVMLFLGIVGLHMIFSFLEKFHKDFLPARIFGMVIGLIFISISALCLYNAPSVYQYTQERIAVEEENPTCKILEKTDDGTWILYDEALKKLVFYRKE